MEWIEGETLAAQMERDGAFAEETVIEIGICLAKAIQKLHQMQPPLLYLDCKPSNVMKDSDGKIADRFWQRAGGAYTRDKRHFRESGICGARAAEPGNRKALCGCPDRCVRSGTDTVWRFCAGQTFPDRLMRLRP